VPPLAVTNSPLDVTVSLGGDAPFSVTISGGVAPYDYRLQYLFSDGLWYDVFGTNSSSNTHTFTVLGVTAAHDGRQYRFEITDAASNSVTSRAATLTVTP
jgi:hypothetical protein